MPKNKSAATRYRVIDQMLNDKRKPFPNLEQLAAKCSIVLKTDVSTSTIEKDIRAMREEAPMGYSAPIVYSKVEGGYVYGEIGFSIAELNLNEEEWSALQFASQLLYQYKEVPIFINFKNAIERINTRFSLGIDGNEKVLDELVQFEKSVNSKGMDLIEHIYNAIKNKQAIKFQYKNIYKGKSSIASLIPYLIKENRNRWYVIFQHSTGIMESNTKPEEILLTILKPISDLVLLEPLHASQKLIIEKTDRVQISLKVLLNEEFTFKILGMGAFCVVNKPASLRKTIKAVTQKMSTNYK